MASHHELSESDVGISEFLGNHKGFFGIIKQRYSDFLVNEIAANGEECHLSDTTTFPEIIEPQDEEDGEVCKEDVEILLPKGVSQEISSKLQELCTKNRTTSSEDFINIDVTELDKNERRAVHNYLHKHFTGLISSTSNEAHTKIIKVSRGSVSALHRDKKRRCAGHSKLYTHFLLYKENMDTLEAMSRLAAKLRVRPQNIGYAGTKDRRGKTVQLAAVLQVLPARIAEAARDIPRIAVGNFSFSKNNIKLGQLSGNTFTIVLREVTGSCRDITTAMRSLQETGVINYYGLQRFGSRPGHTHLVGKHLLRAEWEQAVWTILKPRTGDMTDKERNTALKLWCSGGLSTETLTARLHELGCLRTGGGCSIEATLVSALLQRGPTDFLGAINALPRNCRTLYLHAYQAYLWNKLVSRRLRECGPVVLAGDLVKTSSSNHNIELDETEEADIDTKDSEKDSDVNSCDTRGTIKTNKLHACVRAVSPEEVADTPLSKVLIPSIGYATRMPDNKLAEWYEEMLAEDGITSQNLNSKHKSFAVSGAYRPLLLQPKNISWKICRYTDILKPLVLSDFDRLCGSEVANEITLDMKLQEDKLGNAVARSEADSNCNGFLDDLSKHSGDRLSGEPDSEDSEEDGFKAVVVRFSLPPSGYATMVLREMLRLDTSAQLHAHLSSAGEVSHVSFDKRFEFKTENRTENKGQSSGGRGHGRGDWRGKKRTHSSSRGQHNKRKFYGRI